jgi:hypothetical protein
MRRRRRDVIGREDASVSRRGNLNRRVYRCFLWLRRTG